jgi:transposase
MKLPPRMEMSPEELDALVARVESGSIVESDIEAIKALAETVKLLRSAVQEKTMSVNRLLRMLFGAPTETGKNLLGEKDDNDEPHDRDDAQKPADSSGESPEEKHKPKGHGRTGAADYTGANRVSVPHESLERGDHCPACPKGKVYPVERPSMILCLIGSAPVQACVYELERLRCNLCGKIFTAEPPEACQQNKHDETVGSIIALLKYGGGFPFNRLEKRTRRVRHTPCRFNSVGHCQ